MYVAFFESEGKLSSLKSKVAERKERQVQRDRLLSQLTSLDISVPDLQQLKEACGKNYYQLGTLSMVAATTSPDWNQSKRKKWIEVREPWGEGKGEGRVVGWVGWGWWEGT